MLKNKSCELLFHLVFNYIVIYFSLCLSIYRDDPVGDGFPRHKYMNQYDSDSDDSSEYGMEMRDLGKGLTVLRMERVKIGLSGTLDPKSKYH